MIIKHEEYHDWGGGTIFFKQAPMKRIINVQSGSFEERILHRNQKYLKNGKYFLSMPSVVFKIRYIKEGSFIMIDTHVCFNIEKNI